MSDFIAERIAAVPPSGIRRFFDIAATMDDVISLGIGEPDFISPKPVLEAGIQSIQNGETHYTSNSGILELRQALSEHLERPPRRPASSGCSPECPRLRSQCDRSHARSQQNRFQ